MRNAGVRGEPVPMALDEFLQSARAEGVQVTEDSGFTLDPKEVRKRTATFCAEQRAYPLLRCLQAFLICSDSTLALDYAERQLTVRFDWPEVPEPDAFLELLNQGFTEAFDGLGYGVSQHLFFGLSSALGDPLYRLDWRSPKGGFRIDKQTLSAHDECTSGPESYLSISLDEGWWKRLTRTGAMEELKEELRERLGYCPRPILWKGDPLLPSAPTPPGKSWAGRFQQGAPQLAWRYLRSPDPGRLRPPTLDQRPYREGKDGWVWHLMEGSAPPSLPLSLQFADLPPQTDPAPQSPANREQGSEPPGLYQAAVFLSLAGGTKDWLVPVRDGLLGDPTEVKLSKGGVILLDAYGDYRYDLSGLRLVEDERYQRRLEVLRGQVGQLKKDLRLSLANMSLRAESLPEHYFQAATYLVGGPYLSLVGSKFARPLSRFIAGLTASR